MAIYTNLPIYQASYMLLLDIARTMPILPRDCRYTIGQDLRQKMMEILVLIYRANRTRKKVSIISRMRELLLEVQVYMRLLCDMRNISQGKYAQWVEQTTAMSKQLVAWEKSEIKKQSNGD